MTDFSRFLSLPSPSIPCIPGSIPVGVTNKINHLVVGSASAERPPCFHAFRLPLGAPGFVPPCSPAPRLCRWWIGGTRAPLCGTPQAFGQRSCRRIAWPRASVAMHLVPPSSSPTISGSAVVMPHSSCFGPVRRSGNRNPARPTGMSAPQSRQPRARRIDPGGFEDRGSGHHSCMDKAPSKPCRPSISTNIASRPHIRNKGDFRATL